MFGARDADGRRVVIRSFSELSLGDEQRDRFVAALESLCEHPLEHPSIARPIACGLAKGRPYLVHSRLPGRDLVEATALAGTPNLADLVLRLTWVAGALDFAAATGVFHGTLTARDIIVSDDNAGVSGLGIAQALERAGVPGFEVTREADIEALAQIAGELAGDAAPPALRRVIEGFRPETALGLAEALHDAVSHPDGPSEELPVLTEGGLPDVDADLLRRAGSDRDDVLAPLDAAHDVDVPLRAPSDARFDFLPEREDVESTSDVGPRLDVGPGLDVPPGLDAGRGLDVGRGLSASPHDRDTSIAASAPSASPLASDYPIHTATHAPAMFAAAPVRRRASGWIVTAIVALALGVFVGFAGGFFVGREAPPLGDVGTSPAPEPAATDGRGGIDPPVDAPPRAATPESPQQEPASSSTPADTGVPPAAGATAAAPGTTPPSSSGAPAGVTPVAPDNAAAATTSSTPEQPAARAQTPPAPATGPAAMRIESLPAGAQVFVDGQSVGYAPLVVGPLAPGTHSIRMQLPGYQPWVSAVTLAPGARERVAASLEQ